MFWTRTPFFFIIIIFTKCHPKCIAITCRGGCFKRNMGCPLVHSFARICLNLLNAGRPGAFELDKGYEWGVQKEPEASVEVNRLENWLKKKSWNNVK